MARVISIRVLMLGVSANAWETTIGLKLSGAAFEILRIEDSTGIWHMQFVGLMRQWWSLRILPLTSIDVTKSVKTNKNGNVNASHTIEEK
jgi:hypothetical protein